MGNGKCLSATGGGNGKSNNVSLRQFAKAIGMSHSTLSKIANGKYKADTKNVFKKILSNITGVVIPAEKYQEVITMLNDARFSKFGETSRTAAWLYSLLESAQKSEHKK